jgi:hypothetical protein
MKTEQLDTPNFFSEQAGKCAPPTHLGKHHSLLRSLCRGGNNQGSSGEGSDGSSLQTLESTVLQPASDQHKSPPRLLTSTS